MSAVLPLAHVLSSVDHTELVSHGPLHQALRSQLQEASSGQRSLTAVDCGAGVGRVSEQLLLHHFNTVDLLEPSKHLLDTAQKNLKRAVSGANYPKGHQAGQAFSMGLQEFHPQPQR